MYHLTKKNDKNMANLQLLKKKYKTVTRVRIIDIGFFKTVLNFINSDKVRVELREQI